MSESNQLGIDATLLSAVNGARAVYLNIPAHTIRNFCDSTFPGLAKDTAADSATGAFHRWKEGHDLLVDVLPDIFRNPAAKLHQAGHILLTDFPTKAGIPIPGFSASGLGQALVDLGIPKGYMCLNIMNAAVGILAVTDGAHDLIAAFSGDLTMNCWTAFNTFGTGTLEIAAGVWTQNPLLILGGAQNMLAGVVSSIRTFSYEVDPAAFFGSSLGSFVVGCGISLLLHRKEPLETQLQSALNAGGRAALIGALSSVSSGFSVAAAAGLGLFSLGALAGKRSNAAPVTREMYQHFLDQYLQHPSFNKFWQAWQDYQESLQLPDEKLTPAPPELHLEPPALTLAPPALQLTPCPLSL